MIMYAWKQFGNDFRNGDDAVFWDSNRPRDDNGTKIRPWLQGDKWNFRDVNKKTGFSMLTITWWDVVPWFQSWTPLIYTTITLKTKWDLADIQSHGIIRATPETMQSAQAQLVNDPKYKLSYEKVTYQSWTWTKDWETTTVEIQEEWLYYIEVEWGFMMPAWYNTNNSYLDKFYTSIYQEFDDWIYRALTTHQERGTSSYPYIRCSTFLTLTQWIKLIPCFAHTYTNWTVTVSGYIKLIKMW